MMRNGTGKGMVQVTHDIITDLVTTGHRPQLFFPLIPLYKNKSYKKFHRLK